MFILFFALWVVLNGKWTTEIGAFGLAFAAIMYAFAWRYVGISPKKDFELVRHLFSAVRYGAMLVVEIVKANLAGVKLIFSDEEVKPQLVQFDVDLCKDSHRVVLANSITLTPGTITVDLKENHFIVHALDASLVPGLDDGCFVQALEKIEAKRMAGKKAAVQEAAPQEQAADAEKAEAAEAADETAAKAAQAQQDADGEQQEKTAEPQDGVQADAAGEEDNHEH